MPKSKKPIVFRMAIIYVIMVVLFVLVVGKMFIIQTVKRDELLELDKKTPNREIVATRGNIYSYDGKLMASTVPFYRVGLPLLFPNPQIPECLCPTCPVLPFGKRIM